MAVEIYKGQEGWLYLGETTTTSISGIPADTGLSDITAPSANNKVGRLQSVDVTIDRGLEAYYGTGSIDPTDIKAGLRTITGTVKRALLNGVFLASIVGKDSGSSPYAITDNTDLSLCKFKMQLHLAQSTNYVALKLNTVRFGTWHITFDNTGATVMEDSNFIGIFDSAQYVGDAASGI